jgi:hypothetical protein
VLPAAERGPVLFGIGRTLIAKPTHYKPGQWHHNPLKRHFGWPKPSSFGRPPPKQGCGVLIFFRRCDARRAKFSSSAANRAQVSLSAGQTSLSCRGQTHPQNLQSLLAGAGPKMPSPPAVREAMPPRIPGVGEFGRACSSDARKTASGPPRLGPDSLSIAAGTRPR